MSKNKVLVPILSLTSLLILSGCGGAGADPASSTSSSLSSQGTSATSSSSSSLGSSASSEFSSSSLSSASNNSSSTSSSSVVNSSSSSSVSSSSSSSSSQSILFTVSGTVTGNTGPVTVTNSGSDGKTVAVGGGGFTFAAQNYGTNYLVATTQPTGQTCTVLNGSGTVTGAVSNVTVSCVTNTYTISGSITGLSASGLSLSLSGSKSGSVSPASGATSYAFTQTVVNGNSYTVTIGTQPTGQTCTLSPSPATGTVGTTNIVVDVTCTATSFTINATVSGLGAGKQVTMQINGASPFTMSTNGGFNWSGSAITSGFQYNVTVSAQPSGQTCVVVNGSGTVTNANITNIQVNCTNNPYTIGGTVSGLSGTLVLTNNSADATTITSSGAFAFAVPVAIGGAYNVTVATQPAGQSCSVANGSGNAFTSVTNVSVTCVTNNIAPVANAGLNQTVMLGNIVYLNGTGSSDPNGDALGWEWLWLSAPNGNAALPYGSSTSTPYFIPTVYGDYLFALRVTDGYLYSSYSYVTISVLKEGLYGGLNNSVYLGCWNCTNTDPDSVCNITKYGNITNPDSIWNTSGTYGNSYNSYSPWSAVYYSPPRILLSSGYWAGYFTVNTSNFNRTTNTNYTPYLNQYSVYGLNSTKILKCGF